MLSAEVIVVGAGPAGSAAALLLARQGRDVLLVDQARFPRDKPCGEYLNPAAVAILERLGLLHSLYQAGARPVVGAYLTSPAGQSVRVRFPSTGAAPAPPGLSLPRMDLDAALLQAAEGAGARVHLGFRVDDVIRSGARVTGIKGRVGAESREIRARQVLAADGSRSVVARRLGLTRPSPVPPRIGLVAHFEEVEGDDWVEMHAGPRGYCGLGYSAGGRANVAMVADPADLSDIQGRPEAFFSHRLTGFPEVARRLAGGRQVGRLLVTGSMTSRAARVTLPGLLLIGDAAGFYDPYTGEGISYALRAAELAATAVDTALDGPAAAEAAAFRAYARRRQQEFGPRLLVSRLIQAVLLRPPLLDAVFRRFAADPSLAQRLIGVTAGLLPPSTVLSPAYLAALIFSQLSITDRNRPRHRLRSPMPDTRTPNT